jgi:hypothetical protein
MSPIPNKCKTRGERMKTALAALKAIRDLGCVPECKSSGPWDQCTCHPSPEIIARDALRAITGRIEAESVWGDGTGGPRKSK